MSEITCPHPECEDSDQNFSTERGMKVHHKHVHGESLAKKQTECCNCSSRFSYYPSIKEGILCQSCCNDDSVKITDYFDRDFTDSSKEITKECLNCSTERTLKEYESNQYEQTFCDEKCYNEYRETNFVTIKCENCGDRKEITEYRNENTDKNFCDKDCRLEFQSDSVEVNCDYCGNSRQRPKTKVSENDKNFCNLDCRRKYQMKNKNVDVECSECGNSFQKIKSRFEAHDLHFCRDECQYSYFTKEDKLDYDRYGRGWIKVRRKVRKRDDYECQICGKNESDIGRIPSAHHITSVHWFYNSEDYQIEDAHYKENVVLLCPSHHKKFEDDKRLLREELDDELVDKLEFEKPTGMGS